MASVMTVRQVCAYLKVHQSTIYRLLKRSAIPAFKLGSDWRFNVESIDAWRLGLDNYNGIEPEGKTWRSELNPDLR